MKSSAKGYATCCFQQLYYSITESVLYLECCLLSFQHTHVHARTQTHSLISLLEYAEETLQCHYAFLFLDRSIPESSRKKVLRDFRFLGFELLGPSHNKLPVRSEEYIFMGYEINPGDGSDSDED